MSDLRNVSSNPHIRAKDTTSRIMLTVVIALLLPAFWHLQFWLPGTGSDPDQYRNLCPDRVHL